MGEKGSVSADQSTRPSVKWQVLRKLKTDLNRKLGSWFECGLEGRLMLYPGIIVRLNT